MVAVEPGTVFGWLVRPEKDNVLSEYELEERHEKRDMFFITRAEGKLSSRMAAFVAWALDVARQERGALLSREDLTGAFHEQWLLFKSILRYAPVIGASGDREAEMLVAIDYFIQQGTRRVFNLGIQELETKGYVRKLGGDSFGTLFSAK
jgi:hypothetical protein